MSGSLKMFTIEVTNHRTKETLRFIGQGVTVAEALSDGIKGVSAPFHARQDGRNPKPGDIGGPTFANVRSADGKQITGRTLKEFEQDDGPTQPKAEAVDLEFA